MQLITAWVQRVLKIPWIHCVFDIVQRFGNDNGAFYAAGLAFFLLLSFAPIVLTGVAVLGCFINVHAASTKVIEMIQNLLPSGGARDEATQFLSVQLHIEDQVKSVVQHRGVAGVFGLLALIWATLQIFVNASTAMNAMWEVKETRNWFLLRGMALLLMMMTGFLLVMSLLLSGAPPAIDKYQLPIINHLPIPLADLTVVFEILAIILNTFMYVIIYKMLPNAKVSWYAAGAGGAVASLFFEVAKKGMASYLLRANHSIYGDLANLILFVLWIYYSMMMLLVGAEVAAACTRKEGKGAGPAEIHQSNGLSRRDRIRKASQHKLPVR
jgi:membrane protein